MTEPTPRQLALLTYMREYIADNGAPPTLRDLCERFGWRSTNTPTCHLKLMLRKGLVRYHAGRARGWIPT